ncbi:uncharacterized protein [Dermacentor albipictus]|uniref:uncharacterized protein n=1 Tax=Dermacentor albipictus TaxID=60249 RepID=UPI0031FE2EC1
MASTSATVGLPPDSQAPVDIGDNSTYSHPNGVTAWCEDIREWPNVNAADIIFYLVNSKACDFQQIKNFRALESYNYVQSGWVGKVFTHKISSDLCYVKGTVSPSQSLNATPRTAWACVKQCGEVVTAGCTCMAGLGKACSHVGAILWKIEMAVAKGYTTTSCTDRAALWNSGTKRNVEPATLEEITFKVQKQVVDDPPPKRQRPSFVPMTREEIRKFHAESPFPYLFDTPGTLLYETFHPSMQRQVPPPPANDGNEHGDHGNESCVVCTTFYEKYVALSPRGAEVLQSETASQATPLWFFSRKLRLTASNVNKVPKRETTGCEKAAMRMLSTSFSGNAATKYGKQMEPVARKQFSKKTGLTVNQIGTVVNTELPWLSASPDGIIEGMDAILEIKCPNMNDCVPLISSGKYDVRLNKDAELVLQESGPNGYYSQVQFQMLCTKTQICFFYVWSVENDVIVQVPFDPKYVSQTLPRLKKFYFSELLPRLLDLHTSGKMDILHRYKHICSL